MMAFTGGAPSGGPVLQRSATPVANPYSGDTALGGTCYGGYMARAGRI